MLIAFGTLLILPVAAPLERHTELRTTQEGKKNIIRNMHMTPRKKS